MIFVTTGTYVGFTRLVKHIDKIAHQLNEKIIIQKGNTKYTPKKCESFDFAPSLDPYFKKARLIISHAALSLIEATKYYKKPTIAVPRLYKFKEHINDHQLEFARKFEKIANVKYIENIKELTPELIKNYKTIPEVDDRNLKMLQSNLKEIISQIAKD